MKNTTYIAPSLRGASPSPLRSRAWAFLLSAAAILTLLFSTASSSFAGSATWLASPATGDWNTATNWTAGGPPNGSADTATFASSNITGVSLSFNTEVNGIVFNAGASAFTITGSGGFVLTISGAGITNNSGITQNFVTANDSAGNGGSIAFTNSATAGSLTTLTNTANNLGSLSVNNTNFFVTSTANSATINNNGASVAGGSGGQTAFFADSTAGSATITNASTNASIQFGPGGTEFFTSSTAGSATITNNAGTGSGGGGGATIFDNTATAGSATINNNGATVNGAEGGSTHFLGSLSSAGSATINNNGGTTGGGAGSTDFGSATAASATINNNGGTFSGAVGGITLIGAALGGSATISNNGATVSGATGGSTTFFNSADAGSATLVANGGLGGGGGGLIQFGPGSFPATGGTARVEVFGNGTLDISTNGAGVTIGSIEGSGAVFLGAFNLTVGSNNLSTAFSGKIQDGGIGGGTGGSLTKTGKGKLTLSKASTYTGGTTITKGTLLVTNKTGSGTGTGAVQVNTGTLGGTGKITGAVTVGTGTSSGAILLPGKSATSPGTLTINNTLTFNSLSTYKYVLNRTTVKASQAVALGVTINSNVPFTFTDTGTGTLTVGTVFTVINNTSANPIFGTFSNLANGSTFTSNGNNFQVSYTGGTGNDLTLTVVP